MTEKQRLMHALFGHDGREHRNIKFFRGTSCDISADDLCREAANGIEQIVTGLATTVDDPDSGLRAQHEVKDLIAAL